jgi:hypothetical protein
MVRIVVQGGRNGVQRWCILMQRGRRSGADQERRGLQLGSNVQNAGAGGWTLGDGAGMVPPG